MDDETEGRSRFFGTGAGTEETEAQAAGRTDAGRRGERLVEALQEEEVAVKERELVVEAQELCCRDWHLVTVYIDRAALRPRRRKRYVTTGDACVSCPGSGGELQQGVFPETG
jgi:hypothetical protein